MAEKCCRAPGCTTVTRQKSLCATHSARLKKYGVFEPYNCVGCGLRLSEGRKFCADCYRLNTNLKSRRNRAKRLAADPESEMGKRREAMKKWRTDNPETPEDIRRRHLRHTYKMTLEEYDRILAAQGGGCAICGATDADGAGRRLHVDHDHSCCPGARACGKCNRGLLCKACNTGLGGFRDDLETLAAASRYLSHHNKVGAVNVV